jgi:hypothetical protein
MPISMLIWHAMTPITNIPKNMATPVQLFSRKCNNGTYDYRIIYTSMEACNLTNIIHDCLLQELVIEYSNSSRCIQHREHSYHYLLSSHHAVNQQMYKLSFFIINYALHTINNKQTSTIFEVEPHLMTKTNMFIMLQLLMTGAMACCMVLGCLETANLITLKSCLLKHSGATKKYWTLNCTQKPAKHIASLCTLTRVPAYIL